MKKFELCLCHFSLPCEAVAFFRRGYNSFTVQYFEFGEYFETKETYTLEQLCNNYDEAPETILANTF